MAKIIVLPNVQNVNSSLGIGRSLGLTVAQTDSLSNNFKSLVAKVKTPVKETLGDVPTPNVPNNTITQDPLISKPTVTPTLGVEAVNLVNDALTATDESKATIENSPVFSFPESITNAAQKEPESIPSVEEKSEELIAPFADDAPAIETVINSEPAVETPIVEPVSETPVVSGPEIVEEEKENDFDKMQQEIEQATNEYQEKIANIIANYKKKIVQTIKEANNMKEQASDHLKNAQAAEQIVTMAYQNSMNMNETNPNLELQKIA